jgi:hypothetical protein
MDSPTTPSRLSRVFKLAASVALGVVLAGMAVWSTMAIYYSNLPAQWLRTLAAAVFALGLVVVLVRVRPWRAVQLVFLVAFGAVVVWFLFTPPSNDRDWQPDVAVLPYADINGDTVTVHNIRNCDYRSETDYTARHYDKTFDLAKLQAVDFFLVYWGSPLIAHTMLSFGFEGGDHLCFSIEARKEKGEAYSAIRGFFRQYELTYIIADERDLIRLRTNFRGEQVYLYRLDTDPALARLVLLDYLQQVNRLRDHPEWYNALTSNCTTNIRGHTKPYVRKTRWDSRILVNGYIDQLGYAVGSIDHSLPFDDLKARSLINERAKAAGDGPEFSTRIREGLPGFPDPSRLGAAAQ